MTAWNHNLFPITPLDTPRLSSREQCPFSADKLGAKAAKFLTLAAEYSRRNTFQKQRNGPWPQKLPAWIGTTGWGDTAEAKRYHARRVAEYRVLQAEQFRQAA